MINNIKHIPIYIPFTPVPILHIVYILVKALTELYCNVPDFLESSRYGNTKSVFLHSITVQLFKLFQHFFNNIPLIWIFIIS